MIRDFSTGLDESIFSSQAFLQTPYDHDSWYLLADPVSKQEDPITKIDEKERSVKINHVLVSHPNLFLDGPMSIHGVLGPFSVLDPSDANLGWDIIQSPACGSNSNMVSNVPDAKNMVEWSRIIRLLTLHRAHLFEKGSGVYNITTQHKSLNKISVLL